MQLKTLHQTVHSILSGPNKLFTFASPRTTKTYAVPCRLIGCPTVTLGVPSCPFAQLCTSHIFNTHRACATATQNLQCHCSSQSDIHTETKASLHAAESNPPLHQTVSPPFLLPLCLFSVKGNLGALLAHVDVLEEGTVRAVRLLLDRGAKLHELVGHGLARGLQDVDELARVRLVVLGEQGYRATRLARAAGTADTVDVVFYRQGELYYKRKILG